MYSHSGALRRKTNAVRGGVIEHIYMRNVKIGQLAEAVLKIDYFYEEGEAGSFTPVARNIEMKNRESNSSQFGLWIRAFRNSPKTDISVSNCTFRNVKESDVLENVKDLSMISVKRETVSQKSK